MVKHSGKTGIKFSGLVHFCLFFSFFQICFPEDIRYLQAPEVTLQNCFADEFCWYYPCTILLQTIFSGPYILIVEEAMSTFEINKSRSDSLNFKILNFDGLKILQNVTAWKVSKYGVFSGPYFLTFVLNTEQKKLRIWTIFKQYVCYQGTKNLHKIYHLIWCYFYDIRKFGRQCSHYSLGRRMTI